MRREIRNGALQPGYPHHAQEGIPEADPVRKILYEWHLLPEGELIAVPANTHALGLSSSASTRDPANHAFGIPSTNALGTPSTKAVGTPDPLTTDPHGPTMLDPQILTDPHGPTMLDPQILLDPHGSAMLAPREAYGFHLLKSPWRSPAAAEPLPHKFLLEGLTPSADQA